MKKRYIHDLSNYDWSTMRAGEISPLKVTEVLPNDTVRLKSEAIIRLGSMKAPVYHPLRVKLFHFYGANRQVWPNWNDFIKQGANGVSTAVHPTVKLTSLNSGVRALSNRLGLPLVVEGHEEVVSALPFAHYWNIVQHYFTDQQIQGEFDVKLTDGDNTANVAGCFGSPSYIDGFQMAQANWKKDYFNTASTQPQMGAAVPIPQSNIVSSGQQPQFKRESGGENLGLSIRADNNFYGYSEAGPAEAVEFGDETGLQMDDSAKMRDLSLAGALQLFRENRQQWGNRIIDYLRGAFGSKVSSYELQEPVLINYGEKTLRFSEVVQTAEGENPVGTLRGHGIGGLGSNTTKFTCPEHGFIITLAYIMPEPAYIRSSERFWQKRTFDDYFQKEFEAIGNRAIKNKEIAFGLPDNDGDFGYTEPYDEYRRALNTVKGDFATVDKHWHMAREFGAGGDVVPTLVPAFLVGMPTQRIFDDVLAENYRVFSYHEMIARRVVKRFVKRRIL